MTRISLYSICAMAVAAVGLPLSGVTDVRTEPAGVVLGVERGVERRPSAELPAGGDAQALADAARHYQTIVSQGGWDGLLADARPGDGKIEAGERDSVLIGIRQRLEMEADPAEGALLGQGTDPALMDSAATLAIRHFQRRHGLSDDGVIGPRTLAALSVPAQERLRAIERSAERRRELDVRIHGPMPVGEEAAAVPDAAAGGAYILINIPAARLVVMDGGEAVLEMRTIVGRPAWKTPQFSGRIQHIVVNPYWNVPPNIERREVLPLVRADRGYLERNNMEIVDVRTNEVLDSWTTPLGDGEAIRFRERPGPTNDLGQVKFLFPNENHVYLHDTPAQHLFERHERALSHGCIRLERPLELARWILEHRTDTAPETLEGMVGESSPRWLALRDPLPVHITYLSAEARDDGVYFYPDVYGLDR